MEFVSVLKRRDVFWLWVGQVISAIGDRFFDVAVVWIATEQIGAEAGVVIAAGTVASLVFGLFGGVYADRWNRRTTMIATDVIRAAVLFVVVLISLAGTLHLWHLAVVMAILSALNSLFEPTLYASLPTLVREPRSLQATNALFDVTWRVSTAVGPAIAGVMLAQLPVSALFAVDSLTFGLSALALATISSRYAWKPQREQDEIQSHPLADVRSGIQTVLAHPVLKWALLIGFFGGSIVWAAFYIIGVPLFVADVLGADSGAFGLILAAYGIGNVLSNFVIGNMMIRRRALVLFAGGVVLGTGFMLLALAPSLPLAMAAAFLASIGGPMEDIMVLLIMQDELPPGKIGKVYSLRMVTAEIGAGTGFALAAVIYNLVSVPTGMLGIALLQIIGGVVGMAMFGSYVAGQMRPNWVQK